MHHFSTEGYTDIRCGSGTLAFYYAYQWYGPEYIIYTTNTEEKQNKMTISHKCYKFSAYSPLIRKYLSHNIANWLHDTTCFNCATCHAWQQRSEGEVVAR